MNKVTLFEAEQLPGGGTRSTTTDPSGAKSRHGVRRRRRHADHAAGRHRESRRRSAGDPRWGMRAPYAARVDRDDARRAHARSRPTSARSSSSSRRDPFSVETLTRRDDDQRQDVAARLRRRDPHARRAPRAENREVYDDATTPRAIPSTHELRRRAWRRGPLSWDAKGAPDQGRPGQRREVTYTYDAAKPQRLLTRTDGDNHTVTYGYDNVERVTSVKLPSNATYGFTYDDVGNRTGVTMPNGKTHTYGFSPTGGPDVLHGAGRGRADARLRRRPLPDLDHAARGAGRRPSPARPTAA